MEESEETNQSMATKDDSCVVRDFVNNANDQNEKQEKQKDRKQVDDEHEKEEEEGEEEGEEGNFPDSFMLRKSKRKGSCIDTNSSKKRKKKSVKKIIISLSHASIEKSKMVRKDIVDNTHNQSQSSIMRDNFSDIDLHSLDFYSEMHEDQDPETNEIQNKLKEQKLNQQLEKLEQQLSTSKNILSQKLEKNWEDECKKFVNQVKELKQNLSDKQAKQRTLLAEQVAQSITSKEKDAKDAVQMLSEKNKLQMDSLNLKFKKQQQQQQQQYASYANNPAAIAAAAAELEKQKAMYMAKIQRAFTHNQNVIKQKLEAYKVSKKAEYDLNREKLDKHHQKRKMELMTAIKMNQSKLLEKKRIRRMCHEKFEVEKFNSSVEKVKQSCLSESENHVCCNQQQESRFSNNSQFVGRGTEADSKTKAASVSRCERRRLILQKSHTPTSFVVEIHNEGLRTISMLNEGVDAKERKIGHDFIPWGHKACQLLHYIINGEFPLLSTKDEKNNCELWASQGGLIKCTIADMRNEYESIVGDKDADNHDDLAASRKAIVVLKTSMDNHTENVKVLEDLLDRNIKDIQRWGQKLNSLQTQKKQMNPDGTARLSFETNQKLDLAVAKVKNELLIYQKKNKELQQNLGTAKNKKSKIIEKVKYALKEYQKAEHAQAENYKNYDNDKISRRIVALKKGVLDRRSNGSKSNGFRSTAILLRPTNTRQMFEFKGFMQNVFLDKKEQLIRAEELYLLSIHPSFESELSLSPETINNEWAEPGYQLCQAPKQNLFSQSNQDFSSIKGRQSTTLLSRLHVTNIIGNNVDR